MNNTYTIYIHKNKINNKVYIGQTSQIPEKRWSNGEGYKTSTKFYNAIKKYGWDNFEHNILFENLTQEEANNLEQQLIKDFKSQEDNFGYNITSGGYNYKHSEETKTKIGESNHIALQGIKWSEEHRKKMSEIMTGEGNPFYGKHHTDETKQKISQNRKGKLTGKDHPFYGKKHSKEELEKMSKNRKSKGGKSVKCLNTGEIFPTMMDAARWCGLKTSAAIGQICNKKGKQKTAGKHPITKEKLKWEFVNEK